MNTIAEIDIVDPHCHFWQLNKGFYAWMQDENPFLGDITAIRKDYLPENYLLDTKALNVTQCVHIEAANKPYAKDEVDFLLTLSKHQPLLAAMVAGADLCDPALEAQLDYYASHSFVKGIRQILSWHQNPRYRNCERDDYLTNEKWLRGFSALAERELSFDMQVCPGQMHDVCEVAGRFTDTSIIINHCGLPIADELAIWKKGLFELAYRQNVTVKISGFGMLDRHWTLDSIRELVLTVIDHFGVERVMFASNFPVDSLYASYQDVMQAYFDCVKDFSADEKCHLFANNAKLIYRLEE